MSRAKLLIAALGLTLWAGGGAAVAGEGILHPYAGSHPSAPDRDWKHTTRHPHPRYPQSTYRWDPQRQTWYYTGPNWRYWNPMKPMANPIIRGGGWPPVPSGVYVEPR